MWPAASLGESSAGWAGAGLSCSWSFASPVSYARGSSVSRAFLVETEKKPSTAGHTRPIGIVDNIWFAGHTLQ